MKAKLVSLTAEEIETIMSGLSAIGEDFGEVVEKLESAHMTLLAFADEGEGDEG